MLINKKILGKTIIVEVALIIGIILFFFYKYGTPFAVPAIIATIVMFIIAFLIDLPKLPKTLVDIAITVVGGGLFAICFLCLMMLSMVIVEIFPQFP